MTRALFCNGTHEKSSFVVDRQLNGPKNIQVLKPNSCRFDHDFRRYVAPKGAVLFYLTEPKGYKVRGLLFHRDNTTLGMVDLNMLINLHSHIKNSTLKRIQD